MLLIPSRRKYDKWMQRTFCLFKKQKYIRQLSLFLCAIWGMVEAGFKLNQVPFDATFSYDLWLLRLVMAAIVVPFLFYAPSLEIQLRRAFDSGQEIVDRILIEESSYRLGPAARPISYSNNLGQRDESFS